MPGTSPCAGVSSTRSTRVVGMGDVNVDRLDLPSEASEKCSSLDSAAYLVLDTGWPGGNIRVTYPAPSHRGPPALRSCGAVPARSSCRQPLGAWLLLHVDAEAGYGRVALGAAARREEAEGRGTKGCASLLQNAVVESQAPLDWRGGRRSGFPAAGHGGNNDSPELSATHAPVCLTFGMRH